MSTVQSIYAYEIIDSHGFPTIEAQLVLKNGIKVITSVPCSNIDPKEQVVELRDNDPKRFEGRGVKQAVSYINDLIAPKLINVSPLKQFEIDNWLISADATKNKSRLGSNTILIVSQLILKAGAAIQNIPIFKYVNSVYQQMFHEEISIDKIPTPIFNFINGGTHANSGLEFQEFQIIPSSSLSFGDAYEKSIGIFHELKRVLKYRNATVSVGDEGSFSPNLSNNLDSLEVLNEAVNHKGLRIGLDMFLGIDIAANFFYKSGFYMIKDKPHPLKKEEYLDFIIKLTKNYSILALEDPFAEDDLDNWKKLNSSISSGVYLIGDNLLRMNKSRLEQAIKENICTTMIIKPSQIGTISETLNIINLARRNDLSYIVSHRSSETNDTIIADLAVGTQSEFIKFGAPIRGERVAKYNRLWQIERDELK